MLPPNIKGWTLLRSIVLTSKTRTILVHNSNCSTEGIPKSCSCKVASLSVNPKSNTSLWFSETCIWFVICEEKATHLIGEEHCHLLYEAQISIMCYNIEWKWEKQAVWTMHPWLCTKRLTDRPLCVTNPPLCTNIYAFNPSKVNTSKCVSEGFWLWKPHFKSNIPGLQPKGVASFCCVQCFFLWRALKPARWPFAVCLFLLSIAASVSVKRA